MNIWQEGDPCPTCGAELVLAWTGCADACDSCDCDAAFDCPKCGPQWIEACDTHKNPDGSAEWYGGRVQLPEPV